MGVFAPKSNSGPAGTVCLCCVNGGLRAIVDVRGLATVMGVFAPKSNSGPAGTPCVPTRWRTASLSSSAAFPLKLPQCPSWSGRACISIFQFTYSFPGEAVHRLTWIDSPSGEPSVIFTCTIFFFEASTPPVVSIRAHTGVIIHGQKSWLRKMTTHLSKYRSTVPSGGQRTDDQFVSFQDGSTNCHHLGHCKSIGELGWKVPGLNGNGTALDQVIFATRIVVSSCAIKCP